MRALFGWSQRCDPSELNQSLLRRLQSTGVVSVSALVQSTVRVARLGVDVFVHSGFPTVAANAVFFGPDTYRFARFIEHQCHATLQAKSFRNSHRDSGREGDSRVRSNRPLRILDAGCGSGAGGIAAARIIASYGLDYHLILSDINPLALHFSAINAAVANVPCTTIISDSVSATEGLFDLIVCNPPYMEDAGQRAYRHGGERLGRALSARIAIEALDRLAPGGTLLLYSGVAIVDGIDRLLAELQPVLNQFRCHWHYSEIDPDIFGEELACGHYEQVERIAAIGLVVTCPA
ncbi:MAG: methyltransferase [Herminiimonas sp.]|nr:methyltransferase [Herminiimonas sp.]